MNCAVCLDPESNHTTAMHEQAEADRELCHACGVLPKMDPEGTLCTPCWHEELVWRTGELG